MNTHTEIPLFTNKMISLPAVTKKASISRSTCFSEQYNTQRALYLLEK